MDIKEYIELSEQHDKESPTLSQVELNQFVTVWVRSRFPEVFKELKSSFADKESVIYAYRECQQHTIDL